MFTCVQVFQIGAQVHNVWLCCSPMPRSCPSSPHQVLQAKIKAILYQIDPRICKKICKKIWQYGSMAICKIHTYSCRLCKIICRICRTVCRECKILCKKIWQYSNMAIWQYAEFTHSTSTSPFSICRLCKILCRKCTIICKRQNNKWSLLAYAESWHVHILHILQKYGLTTLLMNIL